MPANISTSQSSTEPDHVLLVIGGSTPSARALRHISAFQRVVCADSGVDHARALGLTPDLVLGDMDSISDDSRAWATTQDARFEIADPDKDQTDTELALSAIVSWRPRALTVLWGGGDRIDHVLGVMAAVAAPPLSALDRIDLWVANDLVHVLHGPRSVELDSPVGTTVSLVPLGGPVTGVTTTGLKWELDDATLRSDSARGVSNVVVGAARIDIGAGVLAVIVSARALIESATDVRVHHHKENP